MAKKNDENKNAAGTAGSKIYETFSTYRREFRAIVWPSRQELVKHTFTVVVISLIFGAYIAGLDGIFGAAFSAFVGFLG